MTDDELRRLLEANTERIEKRFDALDTKLDVSVEHFDAKFELLAELLQAVNEKVDRKTSDLELRMEQGFADTQAMIRFSHAELDRRVRSLERMATKLEEVMTDLTARIERLETTTTH